MTTPAMMSAAKDSSLFKPQRIDTQCASVLHALRNQHRGAARGIKGRELGCALGLSPRGLREVISELRERGEPVCGTPETGYFFASTADELRSTCAFLRSRAMHSLKREARMMKLSLPALLDQFPLKFR